ncbi:MAG TPA: hypothetical protein VMG98_13950 [Verrucomicrobiae bacterium]|nr:hypothetical protein [Verrucomicrobiae bacterium]
MIDVRTKFIAVSIYQVEPENFAAVTQAATQTIERDVVTLAGFFEGMVMADEARTRVLIVTQWSSKHAWAQAFWEPRIGKAVAEFVRDATTYEVQTFEPLTIVRTAE